MGVFLCGVVFYLGSGWPSALKQLQLQCIASVNLHLAHSNSLYCLYILLCWILQCRYELCIGVGLCIFVLLATLLLPVPPSIAANTQLNI